MTKSSESKIEEFIFAVFFEAFNFINPYLADYSAFSKTLSKEVKVKDGKNIQYNFDLELDKIFKKKIEEHGISGRIYSEESGFYGWGDQKYRVVIDPFCNSTLASRSFHEAAAGISVFSYDYKLLASAIIDFQSGIAAIMGKDNAEFYQIQNNKKIKFNFSQPRDLKNSWIVVSLETHERRNKNNLVKAKNIIENSGRIIINSGHIYWLRLAAGLVDGYVDVFKGQKLYEIFACAVAQKNGCVVTDEKGEKFDPVKYLKIFEEDQRFRFFPVAARNKDLHGQLLESLK